MAEFNPVEFLKDQVAKLEARLDAEKRENARLWYTVSQLQQGLGAAISYVKTSCESEEYVSGSGEVFDFANDARQAADDALVPFAPESA